MPKTQNRRTYGLKASPFYRLRNRKKLAQILGTSPEELKELADLGDDELYTRCWKHKKLKGRKEWEKQKPPAEVESDYRPIDIPIPELKAIQRRIAGLLSRITPPDFLFSPVKGRSYVDNAARHTGGKAFWKLDIANYFPTCTDNNVARFFHRDLECSKDVTAVLVRLVTLDNCLPQGSPCSPILAYYSYRPMWLQIAKLVEDAGCTLSLYADDITISGDIVRKELVWEIKKLIHSNDLCLNKAKESSTINTPAEITGVIVKNGKPHLPNRQRKKLAELRREHGRTKDTEQLSKLDRKIAGRLAQKQQVEMAN